MDALEFLVEHEILPRLPLEEFLRLRCVCKRWKELINDPWFVQRHQSFHKNDTPCPIPLLLIDGTYVLSPRLENPSWNPNPFRCPTNPEGILVGVDSGLVCHAIHTYEDENGKALLTKTDFVVSNPITGKYREFPTLVHMSPSGGEVRPNVNMVVRDGVLHQLWVDNVGYCIYDCFATKDLMKERIFSLDHFYVSLPNGWFGALILGSGTRLCHSDSQMISSTQMVELVDVHDFNIGWYEAEEGMEEILCMDDPWLLFDKPVWIAETTTGSNIYRVCSIELEIKDYSCNWKSKTLFRFRPSSPSTDYVYCLAGDLLYVGTSTAGEFFRLRSEEVDSDGLLQPRQHVGRSPGMGSIFFVESVTLADPGVGSTMSSADWDSLPFHPYALQEGEAF